MKIPDSGKRKALIVVDVQPCFMNERNSYIVPRIASLIQEMEYDAYILALFSSEKWEIWDMQQEYIQPRDDRYFILPEIISSLQGKEYTLVHKHTRSVLRGTPDIKPHLSGLWIEEVHLVGLETEDCVLATAFECFDNGMCTYVIEECCESGHSSDGKYHKYGLELQRRQNMTNNSCLDGMKFQEIEDDKKEII